MTPGDFLAELDRRGVRLQPDGNQLRCSAPPGILTPDLVSMIRQQKAGLLHQLRERELIRPVGQAGPAPLSFAQEELWLLHQLDPDSSAYHIPLALRLRGQLSPAVLAQACTEIVRRHQVLRTTYQLSRGRPYQVIAKPGPLPLPIVDLTGLPAPEAAAAAIARAAALHPFDLATGPVIRLALARFGPADHLLLLTRHHIASDGWSFSVLASELGELYAALAAGQPARLPPLAIQYADFARWQRETASDQQHRSRIEHRRRELDGILPVLGRFQPAGTETTGPAQTLRHWCPDELTERVHALARAAGTTVFAVLLAGFGLALASCEGRRDVIVGTPASGRLQAGLAPLIGSFAVMLPVRLWLSLDAPFRQTVADVSGVVARALDDQDLPLGQLTAARPGSGLGLPSAPFSVAFVWQNVPPARLSLAGITAQAEEPVQVAAKFPLTVTVTPERGGVSVLAEFEAQTGAGAVAELLERFRAVLDAGTRDSGLSCQALLRRATSAVAVRAGRVTPPATTLGAWFRRVAADQPDAIAISRAGSQVSYGELYRRAARLASALRSAGVEPESRVALCAEPSPDLVVGMLAICLAGGAYVPLDPADPPLRHETIIRDAGVSVVVAGAALADAFAWHDGVVLTAAAGEPLSSRQAEAGPAPVPGNLAYVIYTSGSTGSPKGVMISHASVTTLFAAADRVFGFSPADVWSLAHSSAFDFSVWEIWGALLHGARLVMLPAGAVLEPAALWRTLAREQVTMLSVTPTACQALLGAGPAAGGALRTVVLGGERCEPHRFRTWLRGPGGGSPQLVNRDGITETTVHVTHRLLSRSDLEPSSTISPIGEPLDGVWAQVTGPGGVPAALGGQGELVVGGAGVARGYIGLPGRTAERFRPDHIGGPAGSRVYLSGDAVRRDPSGQLDYLGRTDEQLQLRGYRVEPGEITAALTGHPAVAAAAAAVRREGNRNYLTAYVVPSAAVPPSAAELRGFLAGRLPGFMVPGAFVTLDKLPLTRNGKLDRAALPPPPPGGTAGPPPRTATERALAELWRELLGVPSVGIHDDFFALGGDSLLVALLHARLPEAFGVELPMRKVYTALDIASLADAIDDLAAGHGAADVGDGAGKEATFPSLS
jgi:nonribosomal peptide synthetase protein BlmVII